MNRRVKSRRTVSDFRRSHLTAEDFGRRSEDHRAFLMEVNQIGGREIKKFPPTVVKNIDATVRLSETEWVRLETKYQQLGR